MEPLEIATRLASEKGRAAGSDAERRAARWLRDELRSSGREASLETVWVTPDWPLVHMLHCALATAGSVLSVWEPGAALGVLAAVLVSMVGDLTGRAHLLRRLTPRRATQNVVSPPARRRPGSVRLTVVANTDAGLSGAIFGWSGLEGRLRRALRGHLPSPLGLTTGIVVLLSAVAIARLEGSGGPGIGAVQFVPTVALLVAFAALADVALSSVSPGANVHASAVGVAMALVAELDRIPLRRLEVELVLAGAGEGPALGMRAYVRSRRGTRRPEATAVLAIEPCGAGTPRWLTRDGQLVPLRYHPRMVEICERVARGDPQLRARRYASHGASAAFPARVARWPAIAIGCRDPRDLVPRAHQPDDQLEHLDPRAMDAALAFCIGLVTQLDDDLATGASARVPGA
jgi:hypothetical protein